MEGEGGVSTGKLHHLSHAPLSLFLFLSLSLSQVSCIKERKKGGREKRREKKVRERKESETEGKEEKEVNIC